jgi:hypothetical protein
VALPISSAAMMRGRQSTGSAGATMGVIGEAAGTGRTVGWVRAINSGGMSLTIRCLAAIAGVGCSMRCGVVTH